jgi:hypothetical protein
VGFKPLSLMRFYNSDTSSESTTSFLTLSIFCLLIKCCMLQDTTQSSIIPRRNKNHRATTVELKDTNPLPVSASVPTKRIWQCVSREKVNQ